MFGWFRLLLRFFIVMASVSALIYFIAGMPPRWAVTLAFGFALLDRRIEFLGAWIQFKSYSLLVSINAPSILKKLRLAPSEDVILTKLRFPPQEVGDADLEDGGSGLEPEISWETAIEKMLDDEGVPRSKWTAEDFVGADQYYFNEVRPGVFERTDSARYSSSIRIERRIESIKVWSKPFSSFSFPEHPVIVFRRASEWFRLELRLPPGWKENATQLFPNATISEEHALGGAGPVIVELAKIPAEYLKHIAREWEIGHTSGWQKRDVKWREALRSLGWESSAHTATHKCGYMTISVNEI